MTYHQLTQEERYRITAQLMCGDSPAEIARLLGRHRSTLTRELRRNATHYDGDYRAEKAHSYAVARRRRCRRRHQFSAEDMARVTHLLRRKWSAEQVAGVLRESGTLRISHETIYRRIRWDKKAGGDLWRYTRIISKFGRKRYRSHDSRGVLPGKRPISDRPVEVETRQRIGHWEGDTVMGRDMRHCVLTLVERKTGYAIIKKLTARSKDQVTKAATRAIRRHCARFKTLTFDNVLNASRRSSRSNSNPDRPAGAVDVLNSSTAPSTSGLPRSCRGALPDHSGHKIQRILRVIFTVPKTA